MDQSQPETDGTPSIYTVQGLLEILQDPAPLRFICEISGVLFVYCQFLYLQIEQGFNSGITLAPIASYSIYQVLLAVYYYHYKPSNNERVLSYINSAINWSTVLLYSLMLVIKCLVPSMNCLYINIPFGIALTAKIVFVHSYWIELTSPANALLNIMRYCSVGLSLTVSLKLEEVIDFSWTSVFWLLFTLLLTIYRPYYIFFGVMAFASIATVITTFLYGFKFAKGESNINEFILCLWLLYLVVGASFTSLSFVINLIHYLDGNENAYPQGLIILSLYLPILTLLTYCLYRKLKRPTVLASTTANSLTTSHIVTVISDLNPSITTEAAKFIPSYLYRFSDTFYQRIGKNSSKSTDSIQLSIEEKTERAETYSISKAQMQYLKSLRDAAPQTCALCMAGTPDSVLMECGHGGICAKCAAKILKLKGTCPMCRENVTLALRIDKTERKGDFVKVIGSIEVEQINRRR